MTAATLPLDVLTACEGVANGPSESPQAAFVTWLVAQTLGWEQARLRVSRARWYAHLRLLKRAGVDVPTNHRSYRKSSNIREHDSVAGLLRMVGKRFRLTADFDDIDRAGTCGTVEKIVFRNHAWRVGVRFDGKPGSYEELRVGRFARIGKWIKNDEQ